MSLNRLKTLVAIADTHSFVEAAKRIFLTPAAVGQQIKQLEKELGVTLFDRNLRTPQLTPLGRALIPKARELIKTYDNLLPSLLDEDMAFQELSIGAVPTCMGGLVPRALAILRKRYTALHIRVVPGLSADLLPLVEQGFLDAAVISAPPDSYAHMTFRSLVQEPYILLAPIGADTSNLRDLLENEPFIRFNRRAWVRQAVDAWLRDCGLKVKESMELDTLETISSMVYHGLGVSIVPQRCVPTPKPLSIQRIPLEPALTPRNLGLISHPEGTRFKLIDILFSELLGIIEHCKSARS